MKKNKNITLRINDELKQALVDHNISPQRLFDEAVIKKLSKEKLTHKQRGILLTETMRLFQKK